MGPVVAYLRVQHRGFKPSLNLLYALAGALTGCHWTRLPAGMREALLRELDARADSAYRLRGSRSKPARSRPRA